MCKMIAYVRVSTTMASAKQDYERQKYLLEHSGYEFSHIYEEHISGGVRGDQREQFNKMIETLTENDTVCFTETSRFGRNYIDCFDMLDIITQQKRANVLFLSNGIKLEGGEKMNPYMWMTVSQFFLQDEFLKRQIGYNTANALKRKKEQGVRLGRPTNKDANYDEKGICEDRKNGFSLSQLTEKYGLSKPTVVKILQENGLSKRRG